MYEPWVLVHVACVAAHGNGPVVHSSTSVQLVAPSPVKPVSHVHVRPAVELVSPGRSKHVASAAHGKLSHALTSKA